MIHSCLIWNSGRNKQKQIQLRHIACWIARVKVKTMMWQIASIYHLQTRAEYPRLISDGDTQTNTWCLRPWARFLLGSRWGGWQFFEISERWSLRALVVKHFIFTLKGFSHLIRTNEFRTDQYLYSSLRHKQKSARNTYLFSVWRKSIDVWWSRLYKLQVEYYVIDRELMLLTGVCKLERPDLVRKLNASASRLLMKISRSTVNKRDDGRRRYAQLLLRLRALYGVDNSAIEALLRSICNDGDIWRARSN